MAGWGEVEGDGGSMVGIYWGQGTMGESMRQKEEKKK